MNSKGMTLIETLVVAAILGFLALAAAQLMVTQMKGQQQVLQKAEALDLKNQLTLLLGDPNNCLCQFDGYTFDDALANQSAGATILTLPKITKSCSGARPALITANAKYDFSQTGLAVRSINLVNIKPTGNPNQYLANLKVYWDERSTLATYAPVNVPMRLQTLVGQPANAQRISACGGLIVTLESVCASLGGTFDAATQSCTGAGANNMKCAGHDVPQPPDDGLGHSGPRGSCGAQCASSSAYGQYICGAIGWICLPAACGSSGNEGGGGI